MYETAFGGLLKVGCAKAKLPKKCGRNKNENKNFIKSSPK